MSQFYEVEMCIYHLCKLLSIDVWFMIGQYLESEGAKKSKYWENNLLKLFLATLLINN